jgi:hypothetical protein
VSFAIIRHRRAGVRLVTAAVRPVPDDLCRDREGAACDTRSKDTMIMLEPDAASVLAMSDRLAGDRVILPR